MQAAFPRAVIFDWDNTLVDNWAAIAAAINATFAKYDLPQWTLGEVKQRCNRAARDSFPEWFGLNADDAQNFFYAQFELNHLALLEKLAGTQELLDWLDNEKIPLFVVSNKRGDFLRHQAAALGWDRFFKSMVGSQDAARDKPARDPVDQALAAAGLVPDPSIWFIGDTAIDMQCAINSGCMPVFIGDKEAAHAVSAALTFSDCNGVQSLLNKLKNKDL